METTVPGAGNPRAIGGAGTSIRYTPIRKLMYAQCSCMSKASTLVKPTITYPALVGRIIEYRRKQLNVHQESIAAVLDITQSAYSRLEKGLSAMTVAQLQLVAAHLRTTPANILQATERYAGKFRAQGGEIVAEKQDSSAAGLLVALGILAAILAMKK
ncbi:MAG: XRE family transcriptional regulator [Gammaproteobacteria bacterium]|nr:XRE family transcriptional regulator [Gammaproteobacteria bacterium]